MWWISVLIVSPIWGIVSTKLFLQAWLGCINGIISIIGFLAGRVDRTITLIGIGTGFGLAILFSLLLRCGQWILSDTLSFGYSKAENTVYCIFAIISLFGFLPQLPSRIKKTWLQMMKPGRMEMDIISRAISKDSN